MNVSCHYAVMNLYLYYHNKKILFNLFSYIHKWEWEKNQNNLAL